MKRIAVFQSDLNVGGIQKSIITMLRNLDAGEYEVDLFVFDTGEFFLDSLPENVTLKRLPRASIIIKYLPYSIARHLYTPKINLEKEYDAAVDFNSYWSECAIGAEKVNAKKRIMWLHSDIEKKLEVEFRYRVAWALGKAKFKRFDELAAVSQGVKDSFYKKCAVCDRDMKITVIPNVVDTKEIFEKAESKVDFRPDPDKYNFCSVGRISYEKGYDILVRHFARVLEARQDVHLYIIGDGPERPALEKQIAELGLGNDITLLGNQPNPFPYVRCMDGFALTSRYEGQGIVIWEAKALGLEIFITRELEIYNEGVTGRDDIAEAMIAAEKKEKTRDSLEEYNAKIKSSLKEVLS